MARIRQCGCWNNAKKHQLVSNNPAYKFQHVYHIGKCRGHIEEKLPNGTVKVSLCRKEHYQWQGEYENGTFTPFIDVEPARFEYWKKRIEKDQARPEAQLMSEYSERIGKPPEQTISYWAKLRAAAKWWQGKRIEI